MDFAEEQVQEAQAQTQEAAAQEKQEPQAQQAVSQAETVVAMEAARVNGQTLPAAAESPVVAPPSVESLTGIQAFRELLDLTGKRDALIAEVDAIDERQRSLERTRAALVQEIELIPARAMTLRDRITLRAHAVAGSLGVDNSQ